MKRKNKISIKTAIIAGIVLFGLILPKIVWANPIYQLLGIFKTSGAMTAAAIGRAILVMTSQFIFSFLNLLVRLSATCFDAMLKVGFTSHLNIVKAGWIVTRDFSNMLFILFLVIIAFATILRIQQYGIRQLLPKIVIIALLINFSLVISSVIIDFSNITANFFIDETRESIGGKSIAGKFTDSLSLIKTHMAFKCDDLSDKIPEGEEKSPRQICEENPTMAAAGQLGSDVITFLISITWGSLVMLITAFVFFAGAIMLLIRIIFIWFLVMIVPFVFICYIMPALQQHWKKWWDRFLKWCFFAPVYAFFVWLAVKVAAEGKVQDLANSASNEIIGMGAIGNIFASSPAMIIHYAFIIALLIGAIIAAKEFSIAGANATMNIVNKAKQGTVNWAKRTSMRPVKALGTAVGAGALTAGGKLFGDTKLGRRMRAKATEVRMRPEKYPQNVAYERLISAMSDGDAMKEAMVKAITPEQRIRKLIATRNIARRGLLRDATAPEAKEAMKTFKSFNDFEAYQKLKESRLDAIEDDTERNNTTQKVVQEGNLNKIPAIALKDERVVAAIGRFASAVQIESLRNASPQHTQNLKDSLDTLTTAGNAILAGMNALDQEKIHHSYASQSGDIGRMTNTQLEKWAKSAGADGIKRISSTSPPAAIHIVAENIPDNQASNIIEKIQNGEVAKTMAEHLNKVKPNLVAQNFFLKGLVGGQQPPKSEQQPPRTVDLKTSEEEFRKAREEAKKRGEKFG